MSDLHARGSGDGVNVGNTIAESEGIDMNRARRGFSFDRRTLGDRRCTGRYSVLRCTRSEDPKRLLEHYASVPSARKRIPLSIISCDVMLERLSSYPLKPSRW